MQAPFAAQAQLRGGCPCWRPASVQPTERFKAKLDPIYSSNTK